METFATLPSQSWKPERKPPRNFEFPRGLGDGRLIRPTGIMAVLALRCHARFGKRKPSTFVNTYAPECPSSSTAGREFQDCEMLSFAISDASPASACGSQTFV